MSNGFCSLCSMKEDEMSTLSLINKNSKIPIGKDRIYKLNRNESLNGFTTSFIKTDLSESNDLKTIDPNSIFEMKMPYICLFCGGEKCKYENPSNHPNTAIPGLIADLYYDCVYASQRPNTCLIKRYNLLETFKLKKIKLIVNCQLNGEHPYCGPNKGLEQDCGYAYCPSVFISEGIEVLCTGFQDMTPPDTLEFMLNIVKRMAYTVKYKKGRVLVHCHAGNGRTGLVNACFFMYYFDKTYNEALREVRKLRKKGLEKTTQEVFCQKFGEYVKEMKNLFPKKRQNIHFFIKNQKMLDYNFDKDKYAIPSIILSYYFKNNNFGFNKELYKKIIDIDFVPKIIFECLEKIVEFKIFNKMSLKDLYLVLNGKNQLNENSLIELRKIKGQLTKNKWELFKKQSDISLISELLFLWLNDCVYYCIDPQKIEQIFRQLISICLPNQQNQSLPETSINNNSNNDIDNNLLNSIPKFFAIYIDNDKNNNSDAINKMINIIKNELSKLEFETIKYISLFLQIIYPTNKLNSDSVSSIDNNNNQIIEYKRVLYKLSLFLLGYNLDKVNSNNNNFSKLKEIMHAKMLIFIFELFIFYKNNNSIYVNDIITDNINIIQENEDVFFKNKNNVDFNSIKSFL